MIIKLETLTILKLNEKEVNELKTYLHDTLTHYANTSAMSYEDSEIARTLYDLLDTVK